MKTIVAAVDFSKSTERIIEAAIDLAIDRAARLYLIHVAPPEPAFVGYEPGPANERQFQADKLRQDHRDVQALAAKAQERGVTCEGLLVSGPTVEKLLEEVDRLNGDVLVIGSHGHGALYHLIVGSVAEGVLRKAKRPVLVVPAEK